MEAETENSSTRLGFVHRMCPAVIPVLLISIGYIDPGKWVATIEGGTHFGSDLVAILLLFNFAAILCQYVAARISVATSRNLAQICTGEYDKFTCMFLGVQAELSAILLDLTMVLGVAHALSLLFGVHLSTGVLLAAIDAVLFPVFATFLDNRVANTLSICSAGLVLFFYVSGVLFSQPEMPFSMNGILTRLNGESAFTLMSLLGANVMPHNFYLHSYFVGECTSSIDASRSGLFLDHFFAVSCIFSGLYLVNFVLMSAAANVFHSTGIVLVTFQDAMSLMEQVFRSPLVPVAFLVLMFISNQITALSWAFGGEVVLNDFLKIDIPGWLHRATIRILAVAPALYCIWTSGAEGIYQLLIFAQILVALMLPSSVIPLFRIASSRQIMGVYKIPHIAEFLALVTFMGMLGLNVIFMVEMVFGSSEWAGSLRWNTGTSTSVPYIALLASACVSLCLMLWLAATPLKSASNRLDVQAWNWELTNSVPDPSIRGDGTVACETKQHEVVHDKMKEPALAPLGSGAKGQSDASVSNLCYDLPETLLMPDQEICSGSHEEKDSIANFAAPEASLREESEAKVGSVSQSIEVHEDSGVDLVENKMVKIESAGLVEKTMNVEISKRMEKDGDEAKAWGPHEETPKAAPVSNSSFVSDGPPSFRSLSGKSEEGGSGTGSLSRLAGLGRAARRNLAAILDEFWGQLYDFHGQVVAEAKAKKLDCLLGVDAKPASSMKTDQGAKEVGGSFLSASGRGSDSHINSSLYGSLKQPRTHGSIDSSYGLQRGSSTPLSNCMQLLEAYSNRNVHDSGERKYSSLRTPPSSEGWDYQPRTVHGYQITSYLDRLARERSLDSLHGQQEIPTSRSSSLGTSMSYTEQLAFALRQRSQNCISSGGAPGFQNLAASTNVSLQPERSYFDVSSSGTGDSVAIAANEKRYRSLPDISGLSVPAHNIRLSNKGVFWDGSTGYGMSFCRASNDPSMYSNSGRGVGPLAFDELTPSGGYRDAFTLPPSSASETGSLWSRQPFEQFGVAEKTGVHGGEGLGNQLSSINPEVTYAVDSESKLLQSFRHCILKLLRLEGSDWLFRQSDGADEELIDRVAAREKFIYEAETREINKVGHSREPLVSSVPNCGDGCVWKADLVVSFGVWCIHRVLDLSLMESRPELWGKYTYVLNRLQGVIDPAFSKPRTPMAPCFCLQIPASHQQRASPPAMSNGMLPPAAKPARGKCTTAAMLLDMIKDVEIAISCRKGRSGTTAGDVAFPRGKENLASVLKRYKRRLSSKPVSGTHDGPVSRKNLTSAGYGS